VRLANIGLLVVLATAPAAYPQSAPSNPAQGFNPTARPGRANLNRLAPLAPGQVDPVAPVITLSPHGNVQGGIEHAMSLGVIFGARLYGGNLLSALELYYYIPSAADNYYRADDYRASAGRVGNTGGTDLGGYFCPDGYGIVGLQGASGLGVDRLGFICGQINDPSHVVALPVAGGKGGTAFKETCDLTTSLGLLTGMRIRSGLWMDSVQGLCQVRK
jgi:hypothetical protein